MPKEPADSLQSFLQRQDAATLAALLLELASDHDVVQARLARMQLADRPDKLAAAFKKTLAAWRRSAKFYGYRESREFGLTLETWLDQVARELLPRDPPAAVALFESFIEADASWFERADDSDGCIGDAVRAACRHWLTAASQCETPADVWPERLMKLFQEDAYGAREEILRRADLLLAEPALRELVSLFESRMAHALTSASQANGLPHDVFKISAALSLLSDALHDPYVKVRAVLHYSPQPSALQQEQFVRAYLDADRPEHALTWLLEPWGQMEDSRQSLLADALGRLGRFDESAPIRQQMFERTLSAFDLHRWLEHLPDASRPEALSLAHQLALDHDDPITSATLLVELGDAETAEGRLVAEPARIDGNNYPALVPLANALRMQGVHAWRDGRVPRAAARHPRSRVRAGVRTRRPVLVPAARDCRLRRGSDAAAATCGLRSRDPISSRAQGGLLGVREWQAKHANRRGRRPECVGRSVRTGRPANLGRL